MRADELLRDVEVLSRGGPPPGDVCGVQHDSRRVRSGDVFVARRGATTDGHTWLDAAARQGAALLVLMDPPAPGAAAASAPWVQVADSHAALALLAANMHGRPTEAMDVVGITGTNGKTTTAFIADAALAATGRTTALLGTVVRRWPGVREASTMTTPEANDLQAMFVAMRAAGVDTAVMEVSSHAIALHRTDAVAFAVAVFTNLGLDHLDFHGTVGHYAETKRRLFTELLARSSRARGAVINLDDPVGRELAAVCPAPVLSFGLQSAADLRAVDIDAGLFGLHARIVTPWGEAPLHSPLIGRHNLENVLAALGAGLLLGEPLERLIDGVARLEGVPGRLERVPAARGFGVFVDYAHTPDALTRVIAALRPLTPGRILVVFGCGGDRDRTKRPLMARAAAAADAVILTSDNPRSEAPEAIIEDALGGFAESPLEPLRPGSLRGYAAVTDRREAIVRAIQMARPGDAVLIAGKGHEPYQEVARRRLPFDDVQVAAEALAELGGTP